jgi:nucleoside triphosphatase
MIDQRVIVVGLVWNEAGELLFCRMAPDRGVFPDQWGFPGGGIEKGEKMEDALRREIREELGIEIEEIKPTFFKDATYNKLLADGTTQLNYMVFLIFHCKASSMDIHLNDEFSEYRWLNQGEEAALELNKETIDTLGKIKAWRSAEGFGIK